jgi:2-polyprenyl-3-methyl-5-hydroxy-6-metoxy-1,4-benzoquinol methylase
LDAGCGSRLLEEDLDPLEDWLVQHCGAITGIDVYVTPNRNIRTVVQGSLYKLPFDDRSFDLITCNMVVEHLDRPKVAFAEVARCLRPGGALILNTPNLLNYGILGNAIATKVLPESWRLRIVQSSDGRENKDIFPVRYKANTMGRLVRTLRSCGFELHRAIRQKQQSPFLPSAEKLERILMMMTPTSGLLVCAHRAVDR